MQKLSKWLLIVFFFLGSKIGAQSGLVFNPGPDRFGDQLMAYIRGKFTAHRNNLDFYLPLEHDWHNLALQHKENKINPETQSTYEKIHFIKNENQIIKDESILFVSDFNISLSEINSFDDLYKEVKLDHTFSQSLKKMIYPLEEIDLIKPPEEKITIAVHVRKGGGFDAPLAHDNTNKKRSNIYADKIWPTKFPPDEFYINALKEIVTSFGDKKYYIHIFTDDTQPHVLAEKFRIALDNENISYGFRKNGNSYDTNIVEDLINMARFDILVRPQSSFSRVAQLIGDHEFIISPLKALWKRDKLFITHISRMKKP